MKNLLFLNLITYILFPFIGNAQMPNKTSIATSPVKPDYQRAKSFVWDSLYEKNLQAFGAAALVFR